MGFDREDFDEMAWDRYDERFERSKHLILNRGFLDVLETLVSEKLGKPAKNVPHIITGGYHVLYRMRLDECSDDVLIRVPVPASTPFISEKTNVEAATARYIKKYTSIPVPEVFDYGVTSLADGVKCFIILQPIDFRRPISQAIGAPRASTDEAMVLDLSISHDVLMKLWVQVARYLLHLSRQRFPRIGSLVEDNNSYTIALCPLPFNMHSIVDLANVPVSILPPMQETYQTADEWYAVLADMHLAQLIFQHNDFVSSRDDCLTKYVARQVFRKLARNGQLSVFGFAEDTWSVQSQGKQPRLQAPPASGAFRLWGDDLRPGNILLDDSDDIAALIDWEFTYAAPTQFALDPPWWLLLEHPETWDAGMAAWKEAYEDKPPVWLQAMDDAEMAEGEHAHQLPLGAYMRESWETGRFWLSYAARKSAAFDFIYWNYLDERFFGVREAVAKHELWKTRIHLLSDGERNAMESFADTKMAESEERILVDWTPEQARDRWQRYAGG